MTHPQEAVEAVARAICAEKCAFYGEPPCWKVAEWPNEACDEPGCVALATAALCAAVPMIAAQEREACAAVADDKRKEYPKRISRYRNKGDTVSEGLYESALYDCLDIAAAIRERGNK